MNTIQVIGIGPGNPDYLLPAARKAIDACDVLVGGKRNLACFTDGPHEKITLGKNLNEVIAYLRDHYREKQIAVIASGDPGFFGILKFLKKHFSDEVLTVIPGISTVQYMFSRLKLNYDDAVIASLHGRDADVASLARAHDKLVLYTDNIKDPLYIAHQLLEHGLHNKIMYVGCNLSYDNELIIKDFPGAILQTYIKTDLHIVVVMNE